MIRRTLLQKIADSGDPAAFRDFYDTVYPIVYQRVNIWLKNPEDCKEATSEVFYTIWKSRETLSTLDNFDSWLFIVCRNEAYRQLKMNEKYRFVSIEDLPVELEIDSEVEFIDDEMRRIYNDAVNELPQRCKLIFLMAKEEGMKYREIADILSITEGTVAQQMSIAIRKISETVRGIYKIPEKIINISNGL